MSTKETYEIPQLPDTRELQLFAVLPRKKEFIRGGIAAFANIISTFPIYKVMFRQQLTGNGILAVSKELYHEGLYYLFRGVGAPIAQKTVSTSLMFGMFDFYHRGLIHLKKIYVDPNAKDSSLIRFAASSLAGLSEAFLTPFERVQTLLQMTKYNKMYRNFLDAFFKLGLREMYTGFTAIACRNILGSGLFLYFREPVQKLLPHKENHAMLNLLSDFVSGAVLGACISTLSFPFNVAKVQMQKTATSQPGLNPFNAIAIVTKERGGIRGLYKGAQVNFFRALLSWGIVNMVYEKAGVLFKDQE